jgi:hypothetical protein
MPDNAPDIANPDALIIATGAEAISFGIAPPTDLDGDTLTITLTALPDYGTVEYWDGSVWTTASGAGVILTADELASLRYTPPASGEHDGESLTYTVSDGTTTVTGTTDVSVHVDVGGAGSLFFSAVGTGNSGPDLFSLDDSGVLTADPIRTDGGASNGSFAGENGGFVQFGGDLYFNAFTTGASDALMKMTPDGTATAVGDGAGGFFGDTLEPSHFTEFAGGLYFRALTQAGDELVRLNSDGTSQVFDVNAGAGSNSQPGQNGGFIEFDHDLYFSAVGTGDVGADLFKLDAAGDLTAMPLRTGPDAMFGSFAGEDGGYVVFDNALYFNAFTDATGDTLFKLDAGSSTPVAIDATGATMQHESTLNSAFHVFDGNLYFNALSQSLSNDTLFQLSAGGVLTEMSYEGHALMNAGALSGFADMDGATYFTAQTGATGLDLFKLDASGTITAIDVNPGFGDAFDTSLNSGMAVFDDSLYFAAYDDSGGDDLFKLSADGTLTTIDLGGGLGTVQAGVDGGFQVFGDKLYFSAYTADGYELVQLDSNGVATAIDVNNGGDSFPGENGGFGVFPVSDVIGTGGDDVIGAGALGQSVFGLDGDDVLRAGAGGDQLSGNLGDDTLVSGTGDDTLIGGGGVNTASYADATRAVTIDLQTGLVSGFDSGSDLLRNIQNVIGSSAADHISGDGQANDLDGSDGNDALSGMNDDDTLTGGQGRDTLTGGRGADVLTGGAGIDTFVFDSVFDLRSGHDVIQDLNNHDFIDLSGMDVHPNQAGDQAFHIVSAFDGHKGEIVVSYDAGRSLTTIEFDLNHDGSADATIVALGDHRSFSHFVL